MTRQVSQGSLARGEEAGSQNSIITRGKGRFRGNRLRDDERKGIKTAEGARARTEKPIKLNQIKRNDIRIKKGEKEMGGRQSGHVPTTMKD